MKFNYDLYRPKKVIQDVFTPDNSYYNAKDVQVSPLTKIGDVADMPDKEGRRAGEKARLLIQKLTPTFGPSKAKKRTIPVRVTDTPLTHKRYVLGEGVRSGFSLWHFVASMKYALLGIALLGSGVGFMVANLHTSDAVKSASDKSSGNVAATGSSHTTSKQKPKAHPAEPPTTPATTPQASVPQDTATASASSPASSDSTAAVPNYTQVAPSPAPKPAAVNPSPTSQPTPTPTATTQPAPIPTPQPTQPTPTPTSSQPSNPPSGQPSSPTPPSPSPSTGSTSTPPSTSSTNTSTTTITTPQSPTSTP